MTSCTMPMTACPPPPSLPLLKVKPNDPSRPRPCPAQYYAPQAFASPLLSWYSPEGNHGWLGRQLQRHGIHASSAWGALKQGAWVALAFAVAGVDWPVRQLSKGESWAVLREYIVICNSNKIKIGYERSKCRAHEACQGAL